MESAELKGKTNVKNSRIKHCFSRRETYHVWVNNEQYIYSSGNRYKISGNYDFLFVGEIHKNATRIDLEEQFNGWRKHSCIAIINREKKAIVVSFNHPKYADELLYSLPDDYNIFLTEKDIPNCNILLEDTLENAIKLNAEYITRRFCDRILSESYSVLKGLKSVLHRDPITLFKYDKSIEDHKYKYYNYFAPNYNDIYNFVKKYKVKKYNWYSIPFEGKVYTNDYVTWTKKNTVEINLPSIKQILNDKVFKVSEKIKLQQAWFYTKYCLGNGISKKDVQDKWYTPYNREEFSKFLDKKGIELNLDNRPNLIYWKDAIKLYSKAVDGKYEAYDKACYAQSDINRKEAETKVNGLNYEQRLADFRNNVAFNSGNYVEYKQYYKSYRKHTYGKWYTERVYTNYNFPNTQLKLNGELIRTSRCASVKLSEAIAMWKLYIKLTTGRVGIEGQDIIIKLEDKNYKVGYYTLRKILYTEKKTDDGEKLGRYEWCIVIGCHYLWIDDFLDFVKYYNLYAIFGITPPEEPKEVKPFKIQIK